jgi:cytochrome c
MKAIASPLRGARPTAAGAQAALLQCGAPLWRNVRATNAKEIMKASPALALLAALLAAPVTWASPQLAQQKTCMACHAMDRKLVGPSYKDVAAKYAGQRDAVDKMAEKIIKGGAGVWGAVPMPANPRVSPDEARQLAVWILSVK